MIKFKINTEYKKYLYTFSGIWLWEGNTLTTVWQGPSRGARPARGIPSTTALPATAGAN